MSKSSPTSPAFLARLTNRYLVEDEKSWEVARFDELRADPDNYRTAHPEDIGGGGYIDPEVLPLVDALNAIDGVCTLQSCCGHTNRHGYDYGGQLYLRLSESMTTAFEAHVDRLVGLVWMERVTKMYAYPNADAASVPHEVIDLRWVTGHLEDATRVLPAFFAGIKPAEGRP